MEKPNYEAEAEQAIREIVRKYWTDWRGGMWNRHKDIFPPDGANEYFQLLYEATETMIRQECKRWGIL